MITYLENLPANVAGFKAIGEITEKDFSDTVMPKVKALIDKTNTLNYLLVLETSLKDFTIGAWMKDVWMGIKHLTKWNRAAIVSDVEAIRNFTDFFSYLLPGEFKGFEHNDLQQAIDWVSEKNKPYTYMPHIAIISSSVRRERKSHRVALYFQKYLQENNHSTSEILDLKEYNFPVFEDTIKTLEHPSEKVLDFVHKINAADGIIIVTPEYNGSFPASLKNVIDLLYDEWQNKPISISTVSAGIFGGSQVLVHIQFVLWKIGALTVTNMFPVPNVASTFDEEGRAIDKLASDKLAKVFIAELVACTEKNK